jgi:cell fate regulator YaaT (PSP1 superfamily)
MGTAYVVRYGVMRRLGHFEANNGAAMARGQSVVIRSERGLEIGEVLCPATDQTADYLAESKGGQVLRVATGEDTLELDRIRADERRDFDTARALVRQFKLPMDLVEVERLFGGERIVLYYIAEQRIDFRELVKSLAHEFQTRVEMRQIGVRDEAKLLADYGDCGKPVCCNTHLTKMPPVSMKMAKVQKSTLDPTKISGRCGRLKCCLRYEFDTYEEYQRTLPPVGARVVTRKGNGVVVAQEILARQVLIEFEDRRRIILGLNEIQTVLTGGPSRGRAEAN